MFKNGNGERLIARGTRKILLYGFLFGVSGLGTLWAAALQWAGRLCLEEYLAPGRPETVDQGIIYLALALTALMLVFFGMGGIGEGCVLIRTGRKISQQERIAVLTEKS